MFTLTTILQTLIAQILTTLTVQVALQHTDGMSLHATNLLCHAQTVKTRCSSLNPSTTTPSLRTAFRSLASLLDTTGCGTISVVRISNVTSNLFPTLSSQTANSIHGLQEVSLSQSQATPTSISSTLSRLLITWT